MQISKKIVLQLSIICVSVVFLQMLQEPRLLYINAASHNCHDVVIVLPKEREEASTWTFVKPFTPGMWCTTAGAMIYTALVVWLLERKINPLLYREMSTMEVFTQIWSAVSTMSLSQNLRIPKSRLAQIAIAIWVIVMCIIASSYMTNFTSMLNVQKVNVSELLARDGAIGYLKHNFRQDNLDGSFHINLQNLKAYTTAEECAHALSEGPNKGGVAAILMDRMEAHHFVSRRPGYATYDISPQPEADTPRSFCMKDFLGFFVITGTVSTLGLIKFLFDLLYSLWRHRQTDPLEMLPPNDESEEQSSVEVVILHSSVVWWLKILEDIYDWLKFKKLA